MLASSSDLESPKAGVDQQVLMADLLNSSMTSHASSSSRASVSLKKNKKGYNFKYKTCSICLSDFTKGEKIRVIPICGHIFHH